MFFFLSSFSYRVTQDWMLVLVKDAKNKVALTLLTWVVLMGKQNVGCKGG